MATIMPTTTVTIDRPAWLDQPVRVLNKIGKEVLTEELENHLVNRIPGHFNQSARHKYEHKSRTAGYRAAKLKKFRSIIDLVKTGGTKNAMRVGRIQIGGTISGTAAAGPGLKGSLILRFPFPTDEERKPGKITAADMADEITRWTRDEEREAAINIRNNHVRKLRAVDMGRKRRKIKIS